MGFDRDDINSFILATTGETQEADLLALVKGGFAITKQGIGQVVSTSGNGKTTTMNVSAGMSSRDVMNCARDALTIVLKGGTSMQSKSYAVF